MKANPDMDFYVVLLFGRRNYQDPGGEYDRLAGPVFGPYRSASVELATTLSVTPGQDGLAVISSTGLVHTPEMSYAALLEAEEAVPPDERTVPAAACALCGQGDFPGRTRTAGVTLRRPDGTAHVLGDGCFYDGRWWNSVLVVPARVFESSPSWEAKHEPFDADKAAPPARVRRT